MSDRKFAVELSLGINFRRVPAHQKQKRKQERNSMIANPKTYTLQIQDGALSGPDTAQLKKLLAAYINKTKLPPKLGEAANNTLSNCKDTDTECTCEWDD